MIKTFRHRGLEEFFKFGTVKGIQPTHSNKLKLQLTALNAATRPEDMHAPSWRLHKLTGRNPKGQSLVDHWAVTVNGNWRLTFYFEGPDAILIDYQNYH